MMKKKKYSSSEEKDLRKGFRRFFPFEIKNYEFKHEILLSNISLFSKMLHRGEVGMLPRVYMMGAHCSYNITTYSYTVLLSVYMKI